MPKIFEWNGYKFFFYSNEGVPLEKCHIHVRKGDATAKIWVEPQVSLASDWGLAPGEITELLKVVEQRKPLILEKWHEYFGA